MADANTRLQVLIEANLKQFNAAMAKFEATTKASLGVATKAVAGLDSGFARMSASLKGMLTGGAVFAAIGGFMKLKGAIDDVVRSASDIVDVAKLLGVTTKQLQQLQAAGATFHLSTETMNEALLRFSKNMGEASKGSGDLFEILKANHVAISGDFQTDFLRFADLVKRATNEEQKNLLVTTALGKGATEMGQLFENGAAGIKKAADAATTISDDDLQRLDKLDEEWAAIGHTIGVTVKSAIVSVVLAFADLQNAAGAALDAIGAKLRSINDAAARVGAERRAADPNDFLAALGPGGASDIIAEFNPSAGPMLTPDQIARAKAKAELRRQLGVASTATPGLGGAAANLVPKGSRFDWEPATVIPTKEDAEAKAAAFERLRKICEDITNQIEAATAASEAWNDALMTVGSAAFDVFANIATGAEDATTALLNLAKQLLLTEAKAAFLHALNPSSPLGPLATLFAGIPGRAAGGPVAGGMPYMVGEHGPELFIPNASGRIAANSNVPGGAAPIINIINNGAKVEQRQRTIGGRSIVDIVIEAVKGDMASGGFDGALQGRFGAMPMKRRIA